MGSVGDSSAGDLFRPRIEEFRAALQGSKRVLVLAHDNPDPDAIASAIGLYVLLTQQFGLDVFIGHGGTIGRAENKAMIKNLDLPIYSLSLLGGVSQFDGVILVDTQAESSYNSLPEAISPLAVFDHHPPIAARPLGAFVEIQPLVGSTTALIVAYLIASGVQRVDAPVATALMYGIKTDTHDLARSTSRADFEAYQWLFYQMDASRLAEIEHPPLPREYFMDLKKALINAKIYGRVLLANIGKLENPDIVAEVADLLLRLDSIEWVFVFGYYDKELRLSVRTKADDADAGKLVRRVVKKLGKGGGHDNMAAAQVPLSLADAEVQYDIVQEELMRRILTQLGERVPVPGERDPGMALTVPKKQAPRTDRGVPVS